MQKRSLVYLESSVISYYVSRPSRDPVVLGHQETTRRWWVSAASSFELCISPSVIDEVERGDPEVAAARLRAISGIRVLLPEPFEPELVSEYLDRLKLPTRAVLDAVHIAAASLAGVDYLVTWNCRHIANAQIRCKIAEINRSHNLPIPVICTPEELNYEIPE